MKWLYLLASIIFEVLGTTSLKLSSESEKYATHWITAVVVFYVLTFWMFQYTMKYFELGTVYAIWSGVGVALLAVIGVIFFGDQLNIQKIISILLIIGGIIGLNLSGMSH